MCFSKEISLSTFTVGTVLSLYIFFGMGSPTDKIIGGFFGYVSLMQFIEYLLWDHQICDDYHKSISNAGMWLNHLQPVVLGILVLLYGPDKYRLHTLVMIGLYSVAVIKYSLQYTEDKHCTAPKKDNPHLVWNWNTMEHSFNMYLLFLVTMMTLYIFGMRKNGIIFAILSVISLVTSMLVYPRGSIGAMWCLFAAFSPLIYMFGRARDIF